MNLLLRTITTDLSNDIIQVRTGIMPLDKAKVINSVARNIINATLKSEHNAIQLEKLKIKKIELGIE